MLEFGNLLTAREVAKRKKVSLPLVHRWILRGARGHKLKTVWDCGLRKVPEAELERFLRKMKRSLVIRHSEH